MELFSLTRSGSSSHDKMIVIMIVELRSMGFLSVPDMNTLGGEKDVSHVNVYWLFYTVYGFKQYNMQ